MKKMNLFSLIVPLLLITACASGPSENGIASTANTQEEINKQSELMGQAQTSHVDVLAAKDFEKASVYLERAKSDHAKSKSQETIIEDLRYSKANLDKAYATASGRREQAPGLFEARHNARVAGAADQAALKSDWRSLDNDVNDVASTLPNTSAEKLAKLQARYVELETKAVIQTQLGEAQTRIKDARTKGAASRAPDTLRAAELAEKSAETSVTSNVRQPSGYISAVNSATVNAKLLSEVMDTINSNGKNISEKTAISMVEQKRQISTLNSDLYATKSAEAQTAAQLGNAQTELNSKAQALDSAQASVAIQEAIERSRSQFSSDEAEAYQQGGNLLLRLKSVGFASGKSELPENSKALLEKVSDVAKSLNAREIKVEGHTDSVGTSAVNHNLSEKRAEAVAGFLKANGFDKIQIESDGYGFEKPIATNKSKEGRAQNRRVDVIIVPQGSQTAVQ